MDNHSHRIELLLKRAYSDDPLDEEFFTAARVTVAEMEEVVELVRLDAQMGWDALYRDVRDLVDGFAAFFAEHPDWGR